jgi:hypothetical protein
MHVCLSSSSLQALEDKEEEGLLLYNSTRGGERVLGRSMGWFVEFQKSLGK